MLVGLAVVVLLAAENANAGVIVRQTTFGIGYGGGPSSNFTSALDAATGNDVTVVSDLSDLDFLLMFDGLWLDLPETDDNPLAAGQHLTPFEIASIQSFILTGRRVVMIGENHLWTEWDNQILGIVGGTKTNLTASATGSKILAHELTDSAETISVFGSGFSSGGTPLYEIFHAGNSIVTLWGGNVLTILDSFVVENSDWTRADNAQFATNVANWVAGPSVAVPEPATLLLLGTGLAAVGYRRRRK